MAEFSFLTKLSTWKSICNPLYFRVKQYCDDKKVTFPEKRKSYGFATTHDSVNDSEFLFPRKCF